MLFLNIIKYTSFSLHLELEKTIEEMRSEINSLKYLEIYSHLISNKENHMSDNQPQIK